jgi:methylamine dehydrogenase heavy chain
MTSLAPPDQHPRRPTAARAARMLAVSVLLWQGAVAQLPPEPSRVERLPASPGPHWVWVNDFSFFALPDGKAFLVDGDAGKMLGLLSTGFSFTSLVLPRSGGVIYSPETYLSRGTRGTRTDVVTIYDSVNLQPLGEIGIPPKRASIMAMLAGAQLTDDDRFLLIYNFTPAQSVTVIDTRSRKFVGEIETSGCALVYPTAARTFFSICGDGSLLVTTLSDEGKALSRARTKALFDGNKDPLTEKGVRLGDTWLFASFEGTMYPLRSTRAGIELEPTWPLFTAQELAQHWRTGGLQHLAVHRGSRRLFAIVHQGGPETHKDPGLNVWVYDLGGRSKVQQIAMRNKVASIQVTQDAQPLLFGCSFESNRLDVYDASSGDYRRTVEQLGITPGLLMTPQ